MTKQPEPADVVIVGAGPSGAVAAHTLATAGFSIVCLEQGDWMNPGDYPANKPEWELLIQRSWHHDPNIRKREADYPVDVTESDMYPVMFNAVGGSSIFYGAEWMRLLPTDFRVRTLDGVADDWPISYAELAPFYEEVERFIGVSGVAGDPAYPPMPDYVMPPLPMGRAGVRAAEGMNKLGWHWWPGTNAIPPQRFGNLEGCARWGMCEWGCPESSKASFDLAYWPKATAAGAQLITGARAREITTDSRGLANGVIWVDRAGQEHMQRARSVVMAANGVGTPRLLLLSASARHPDGLANSSGLVGRNLMLHPNCSVTGLYDDDLESYRGPAGQLIYSLEYYDTRPELDFVRGAKWNLLPVPGVLSIVDTAARWPFDRRWGGAFHDLISYAGHAILWAANTEDLPEPGNRVTLSDQLADGDGIPAPKVQYSISENTRRMLRFNVARMEQAHDAAGAAERVSTELWIDQPGHLLGTARMGNDPAASVVDRYGRAHDVPNLYIVDGSVFVTGGGVNPTASIAALALRTARHIAEHASEQVTPL
jgi:choline dehydrogenase-like flavoprotein